MFSYKCIVLGLKYLFLKRTIQINGMERVEPGSLAPSYYLNFASFQNQSTDTYLGPVSYILSELLNIINCFEVYPLEIQRIYLR